MNLPHSVKEIFVFWTSYRNTWFDVIKISAVSLVLRQLF